MSIPEISAELFLSPHTVKSQAVSIYRMVSFDRLAASDLDVVDDGAVLRHT